MFRKRQAKSPLVVGLDLDPSHVAAVEVADGDDMSIRRSALTMLRPGIIRDGEVTDPEALAETLQELFVENGLPTRVRIGVANQRIVVRTMDLEPLLDHKALAAAVVSKAPDHIPMPIDEAVIDHQSLGVVNTPHGPRTRVVVVAVRREVVERLARCAMEAGLTIEGIDLSAFAMVRAVGVPGPATQLYVSVGGLTNVAVAGGEGVRFARASAGGVEAIAHTLAERRALTLEHARQWLIHVGMVAPVASIEGNPELVLATRAALEEGIDGVANAIRSSVEYYHMQEDAQRVDEGILTGPVVDIPGFAEALGNQLHIPLTPAVVPPAGDADAIGELGRLSVAAGLAVEDRGLLAA